MSRRRRRDGTGRKARGRRPQAMPRTDTRQLAQRRCHGDPLQRAVRRLVRRRPLLLAGALALVHVVFALLTFQPQPHTGGDNAAYIALATSLVERGSYTELWDPAQPPHTKYPPVFPAVLALALVAGLKPFVQLKFVILGFSAAAVAFSFLWIRGRGRPALALAIGVLLAVAPGVLREGRWILSDVPFWCFTMIALWAFERFRGDWPRFAIGAAALLLAYFTRTAGLPLALAALAWLGWRGYWRHLAGLALIVGVPALLWWLRGRAFGPAGYASEFWLIDPYRPDLGTISAGDLGERVLENLRKYAGVHLPILLGGLATPVPVIVSAATFMLALAGWVDRVRRMAGVRVADLFLPLYLGLILVWPAVWSGERFLLPALPLLLYFGGSALGRIASALAGRFRLVSSAAAGLLLLMLAVPGLAQAVRAGRDCTDLYRAGERYPCIGGVYWQDFFRMAEWSRSALPADAVVLSRKPRLFYLLSERRSAIFPLTVDTDAFFTTAAQTGARYVVFDGVDAGAEIYLLPVLAARPAAFCLLHAVAPSGTALFGILPGAAEMPASPAPAGALPGFEPCGDGFLRDSPPAPTGGS
jgi:hypothetical protein